MGYANLRDLDMITTRDIIRQIYPSYSLSLSRSSPTSTHFFCFFDKHTSAIISYETGNGVITTKLTANEFIRLHAEHARLIIDELDRFRFEVVY